MLGRYAENGVQPAKASNPAVSNADKYDFMKVMSGNAHGSLPIMFVWFFVRQRRKVTPIRDVLQFSIRKKLIKVGGFQ